MVKKIPVWPLFRSRNTVLAALPPGSVSSIHPKFNLFSPWKPQEPATVLIMIPFLFFIVLPFTHASQKWDLVLLLSDVIKIHYIYSLKDFLCSILCLWDLLMLIMYAAVACFLYCIVFPGMHLWLFIQLLLMDIWSVSGLGLLRRMLLWQRMLVTY